MTVIVRMCSWVFRGYNKANIFYFFYCVESMLPLLPSGVQTQVHLLVPSRKFDLSYDLNFATMCTDFQENIEFQFSLGWKVLVHRFLGSGNAQRALKLMEQNLQSQVGGTCMIQTVVFFRQQQNLHQKTF